MSDTPSVEDGESTCPTLAPQTRYICFVVCLVLGILISLGQLAEIFNGTKGHAIWITAGDLLILGSSLFISSFKTQWQKMMHPLRATTTIVLLASIACTLIFVILDPTGVLYYIAATVQYCALFWYVLSLIPGGQKCCTTCLNSCKTACCGCVKGETA